MARRPNPEVTAALTVDDKARAMFARAPGRERVNTSRASFAMTQPVRNATISSSALRQINADTAVVKRRRRNRAQSDRSWQSAALDYAEQVGELGALLTLQSNIVALCAFPVRRYSPDDDDWKANDPESNEPAKVAAKPAPAAVPTPATSPPPGPADATAPATPPTSATTPPVTPAAPKIKAITYDSRPANVMRAFVGPEGESAELIRRAAWNLLCTGECTLLGVNEKGSGIMWEFLSVEELYPDGEGNYVRARAGQGNSSGLEPLPADAYTGRLFKSSERFSELAVSQVKKVLPILQEIVTLTQMIDVTANSRLAAKLLFLPQELSFASSSPADDDPENDEPDLDDELFDHMTAPTTNQFSAARLVPLVIRGPGEQGANIKLIDLGREFDQFTQQLRAEALGRLANGLDAPPEALTGKSSLSHWTAASIDSEFVVKHCQPIGKLIADFITIAYLRPMLVTYEGMTDDEAATFRIIFDPSPVIARADEAQSARDLADWLSDDAILMAHGFTKGDMANEETIRQRRLWQLVSTQPGQFGKLITYIDGMADIDPEKIGGFTTTTPGTDPNAPVDPNAPAVPVKATNQVGGIKSAGDGKVPATGSDKPVGTKAPSAVDSTNKLALHRLLVRQLATAASASMDRAFERAGTRIVSSAQTRHPELRQRVRSARKAEVMGLVTSAEFTQLGLSPTSLFKGAWDELAMTARAAVSEFLEVTGTPARQADEHAALIAQELCERMQTLSAKGSLPRAARHGLRVSEEMIEGLLRQPVFAGAR